MTQETVIASAARTPIGRMIGGLSSIPAPQLGAVAIKEALKRAQVAPAQVDYVIMGNVIGAGVGQAPARQAAIAAGIPDTISALTVNKVCASSLTAVVLASQQIQLGEAEVVVAGGMENMSLAPHILKQSRTGMRLGNAEFTDSMIYDGLWCPFTNQHMGNAAEAIAKKHGLTRRELDEFSVQSHHRAVEAAKNGGFDKETTPVEIRQRSGTITIAKDEGPRPDSSLEALSRLPPAFDKAGICTAGNASQISDGAAATVVMSARRASSLGIKPLARIAGYAHVALEPLWLFEAPPLALKKLLDKLEWKLEDVDFIEVNEAFAAQIVANGKTTGWDWNKVNVKGGAVALGHPLGATGARILATLLYSMEERNARRGIAALCHGGGGAVAVAVERL